MPGARAGPPRLAPRLRSKVVSLAEAGGRIADGCRLALGGFAVYQHPMALVRELARQGRRDLAVVGAVNGNDVDRLAGAGCLRRAESSYVGLETYGLAPNFRRRVERGELERLTAEWAAGHPADELGDLLSRAGVPAARVATIAEVADTPQLRHRGRITRVEPPSAGAVPVVGPVIGLSESPAAIRRPAPRLGEHPDAVLREWLGLPPERITALRSGGVV